jgi:SAM-dependent methyltransferase
MSRVPRELFVPEELRSEAYYDLPLPIGFGQTISAPHMVAIMCEILDLQEGMTVLEVGGGRGYHAAVMAYMVGPKGHVYSVERIPELVARARENLSKAGITNVTMVEGDGSLGLPEHAPYDRISVAAMRPKFLNPHSSLPRWKLSSLLVPDSRAGFSDPEERLCYRGEDGGLCASHRQIRLLGAGLVFYVQTIYWQV